MKTVVRAAMAAVLLSAVTAGAAETPQALYRQGVEFNRKGQYAEAIKSYTKALELKKDSAELYFVRGRAYRQNDQLEQAAQDFTRAIALKPGYADAYNHRGVVYIGLGKKKDALADFTKACTMGNKDACANQKKFKETP
jgi:Flp pilus assembly protein TadD